jgi:hypothetical protein
MVIGYHYELLYAIYLSTRDLFPSPFTPITLTSSYLLYLTSRGYSSISTRLSAACRGVRLNYYIYLTVPIRTPTSSPYRRKRMGTLIVVAYRILGYCIPLLCLYHIARA